MHLPSPVLPSKRAGKTLRSILSAVLVRARPLGTIQITKRTPTRSNFIPHLWEGAIVVALVTLDLLLFSLFLVCFVIEKEIRESDLFALKSGIDSEGTRRGFKLEN